MILHICNHYKDLFENACIFQILVKNINEKVENSNNNINKLELYLSYIRAAIGIIYYNNYDGTNYYNREKAIQLFKLANKCNNPVSQYYLGICYIQHIHEMYKEGSLLINMAISNNHENLQNSINQCYNYFQFINETVEYNDNKNILLDAYISNIELKLLNEINNNNLLKKEANHILVEAAKVANESVAIAYNTFNKEFIFDASVLFDNNNLFTPL